MTGETMGHRPNFWLVTSLLAVVFAACTTPADDPKQSAVPTSITAEELNEQIQRSQAPLILDVRTKTEYARGHIPGALNIPHNQLRNRLSEIDVAKTEEIVVHCYSGHRAKIAKKILIKAGYLYVRDLHGHMSGWKSGSYPIEKP